MYITMNFQLFKLVLEKAEEPEIKLPTSGGSSKTHESSRKTSISALLTMPKPLIMCGCGTIMCGDSTSNRRVCSVCHTLSVSVSCRRWTSMSLHLLLVASRGVGYCLSRSLRRLNGTRSYTSLYENDDENEKLIVFSSYFH